MGPLKPASLNGPRSFRLNGHFTPSGRLWKRWDVQPDALIVSGLPRGVISADPKYTSANLNKKLEVIYDIEVVRTHTNATASLFQEHRSTVEPHACRLSLKFLNQ